MSPEPTRRGRRPGAGSSRAAILDAAREEFAAHGFRRATVRRIAAGAGVDPAMINHHFGGKHALFTATLDLPFDPTVEIARAAEGPPDRLAERLLARLLELWDSSAREIGSSFLRTALEQEDVMAAMRGFITEALVAAVPERSGGSAAETRWRASLVGSQLLGLVMGRYLVRFEPLASADRDAVVAAIAPTVQRYLTGPLPVPALRPAQRTSTPSADDPGGRPGRPRGRAGR